MHISMCVHMHRSCAGSHISCVFMIVVAMPYAVDSVPTASICLLGFHIFLFTFLCCSPGLRRANADSLFGACHLAVTYS